MRDFLIGIFIFLLLPNLYVDSVVFVAFKLQQDYIVNNLCVQKDEVVNTCNGSCVLTNQLKAANKKQKESNYPGSQKTRIFPVYIASNSESNTVLFSNNPKADVHKASIIPWELCFDILRPPKS